MWWLDPGKEILNILFNRMLGPYVENLDMSQVGYGITQGFISLRNLRMKRSALDKFRLPIDVKSGHLGLFSLRFNWLDLGNKPVEVVIEDVYLLVAASALSPVSVEEDEARAFEVKMERLENAELLRGKTQSASEVTTQESQQNQGLVATLIGKILNNLQITVKNIHIRYEDSQSVPGHPFAAGITLASFSAISTNGEWQPAFIEGNAGSIHKLAKLESLALYFDTDTPSIAKQSLINKVFADMIAKGDRIYPHQYILRPVTGEGRIIMNHKLNKDSPRFDVQLLFGELGFVLDDMQYRDTISLLDMFHYYARQHQYKKYRPDEWEFDDNRSQALLRFAGKAVLASVHEKKRQWSWGFFKERRDDRNTYVNAFKKKLMKTLVSPELEAFTALERKLSYEDIRFYRSIARSQLKNDLAATRKLDEERQANQAAQQSKQGWFGWAWGSSKPATSNTESTDVDIGFGGTMTEQQRKELYQALDYDEEAALAEVFVTNKEALMTRVAVRLKQGSFALKQGTGDAQKELISLLFDGFRADGIQRPETFEVSLSLRDFRVFDGTTTGNLYNQIVHVKGASPVGSKIALAYIAEEGDGDVEPFVSMKFEQNPLDERANYGLSMYMRSMEIIYHKGYVEAIYAFFKPPESQLQSVEALLDVASSSLQGLREETRAGLEYALYVHKTIDVQMNMHAPVIIVPESVLIEHSRTLVIDAGRIIVESNLADKQAVQEVYAKKNTVYEEEDWDRLESLMYDRFFVKFHAAQLLIGDSLQECREALESTDATSRGLHVLETLNIDFEASTSIRPELNNLSRLIVQGRLPNLQVNFSDTKYKALMGLIDAALPHFSDDAEEEEHAAKVTNRPVQVASARRKPTFQLPTGLFGAQSVGEYTVDDSEENPRSTSPTSARDAMYERVKEPWEQHLFEFSFQVDVLQASIFRSTGTGTDKPLGDIRFDAFAMSFLMRKFDMTVDLHLRSMSMTMLRDGMKPIPFVSSPEQDGGEASDLMTMKYSRVQSASPQFVEIYKEIDQSVDIKLSTFIFQAEPEPVLSIYNFIMTTFVPEKGEETPQEDVSPSPVEGDDAAEMIAPAAEPTQNSKIQVLVWLKSVEVVLINDARQLATLALSTADVTVMLLADSMDVSLRLGNLSITDDSHLQTAVASFKQILSFEGEELVELHYKTYGPNDLEKPNGAKSSISLKAGSLKFCVLEQPLHDVYLFLTKLARLKGLYDAATQAAVQRASEIDRMCFDISIKSPILVFPADITQSKNVMVMRLGEIHAKNGFENLTQNIEALLQGIQLTSTVYVGEEKSLLKIIDDVHINTEIVQTSGIDRSLQRNFPEYQILVRVSDVNFHLTETQYCRLIALSQSIVRIFDVPGDALENIELHIPSGPTIKSTAPDVPEQDNAVEDLKPELSLTTSGRDGPWTSIDLVVTVNAVKLHLYDAAAHDPSHLKDHGITKFALNNSVLRCKMLSDGAMEAEVSLKSFTMSNTRPGLSKFREMIPAAKNDRNQFMLLYTTSGGLNSSSVAVITVDTPQIVLAIDPLFGLMRFFTSPFQNPTPPADNLQIQEDEQQNPVENTRSMDIRFDLHDVSVSILESDTDPDSQAIRLLIKKINLSQQGILAMTVEHLAMSLLRMGHQSDSVRFLDDVDIILSMDSRKSESQEMMRIDLHCDPIVFRASYRDINLIMSIVNKAVASANSSGHANDEARPSLAIRNSSALTTHSSKAQQSLTARPGTARRISSKLSSSEGAKVIMSKEHLDATFEGFRLVLINDVHEIPMFHVETSKFALVVKDWSTELNASTSIATSINYWNFKNSHWEPLIDPWTFSMTGGRDAATQCFNASLLSNERLDINLSTSFIELALSSLNMWNKEGGRLLERARGSYAPYRIRNRTGGTIFIWSDIDGSKGHKEAPSARILQGQTVDWRFDDWRTMREHVSSSGHNALGIQFEGKPWEQLRSIPVDREGEYVFALRPKMGTNQNKLVCEVLIEDTVKVVTFRSTYKIENHTLYRLELAIVDEGGRPVYAIEKIAPGKDFTLPIEAVGKETIRLQPDQGFGYKWSPPLKADYISKVQQGLSMTVKCPHTDPKEAPFRFQVGSVHEAGPISYQKVTLKLRAPMELENLLPYNVRYTIFDRDSNQTWSSYLRQGGLMPIHSVELNHLILLSLTIQDADFQPSEFSIINTDGKSDFTKEASMTLPDSQGRKLNLRLNYVNYENAGGAFKVQFYSPYIVINKTGLPFSIRALRSIRSTPPTDVAGLSNLNELTKPTPFMFSHYHRNGNEFIFKVGDSMWSKAVGFEAPSAESAIVMPSQSRKAEVHIGITWAEGLGKYKLSKVINLVPRFFVKNTLDETIWFREYGLPLTDKAELRPGDRAPLHHTRPTEEKLLTFAYTKLNASWSQTINIEDIGPVHFRLNNPATNAGDRIHLIVADIVLEGASIFVTLRRERNNWPFIVENNSDYEISIGQIDEIHEEPKPVYKLQPRMKMPYAWDYPSARDKKIQLECDGQRRKLDVMEIGNLHPLKLRSARALSLDVRAEGPSQVLSVTNYAEENSMYRLKRRDTGISRTGTTATSTDFEAIQENVPPSLVIKLDLEGLGVSLINKKLMEVVYFSIRKLKFDYAYSAIAQSFNIACGMIQIDNQVHGAYFPVLLQPTPITKQARGAGALPTLQASIVILNDSAHGVLFVKYASILFQALTVQVDEGFLYAVLDLTKLEGISWEAQQENISAFTEHPKDVPDPSLIKAGQEMYFEVLELQPVILSVSFVRNVSSDDESQSANNRSPLAVLVDALTMTLGNLEDASLQLNALGIKDMRLSFPEIQSRIMYHYRQEVLRQLYRVLGSADFLGNPVGLFTNVSSGVADIFYEPWHGAVVTGNQDLGIGIAKGAASFVKKTVFGVSDSVTKVTSSLGKGLSAATFDPEYQTRRTMAQRRNKPRHAIYGIGAGVEAFANSVASGFEGVLMKPIEGAETEGAVGFFKGMGRGMIGAVTKPVVGVFDLASNVSEGIRNTTTVFDTPQRDRVRKPRLIPSDGVLRPYDSREALGQYWMKDLENGNYRRQFYVAHLNLSSGDDVVLLTQEVILYFWSTKLRLNWELRLKLVQGVSIEDTGIRFASKLGRDQDRFVYIQDRESRTWFFNAVAQVVKTFNAQRRLER